MIFKSIQIDNYIKNPNLEIKAFLVYGSNEGLQRDVMNRLAKSVCADLSDAFSVAELEASAVAQDIGVLYAEFNSQSLMGGRRVILLRDVGNDLTKKIRLMLDESKSSNLIIMTSSSMNSKSSLVKLAQDSSDMAVFACYEDKKEDINQVLRSMGLTFEPEAISLLHAKLSEDRMINLMELDKLATYMGTAKNVTVDVVNKIISDASNFGADDIYYATLSGDRAKAIAYYNKYLSEGNEPISIIRALVYHFMKLLDCRANMEQGDSLDRAMQKLIPRIIFFRVDSFKQQVTNWNKEKILNALEILFEAEETCKTTNMPVEDIVSRLLLRLSQASKRG